MNTQHITDEILVAFAAGELNPADAQIVASHTVLCAECARTVALFKTIRLLVRTDQSRDPPPATVSRARAIFTTLLSFAQHIADEKLVAFVAGELKAADARNVTAHLAHCADCSKTVASFKTVYSLMRADDGRDPPQATVMRARAIFQSRSLHIAYDQLIAFAAGDLNNNDAREVAHHIAACAECAKTVTQFKTIRAVMRGDSSMAPPAPTVARAYAIFTKKRPATYTPFWRRMNWSIPQPMIRRAAMAVMLVLLVLSNIIVYAGIGRIVETSQAAIPGDSLYGVKRTIEDVQLATTWDTAGKLMRHLAYAGYRIDETGALVALNRVAEIPSTLAAFEIEVRQVATTFKILTRENLKRAQELAPQIESSLAEYSTKLETIRQTATSIVQPAFERAIQVSNASHASVHDATVPPLPPGAPPIVTPVTTITPVFDSSSSQPGVSTKPPTTLPRTSPGAPTPTSQPAIVGSPTPKPTQPAVASSPTPTKSLTSSPTATRTLVAPPPSKTPQPTDTLYPTRIPPGLEKKTLTPVPTNPSKSK